MRTLALTPTRSIVGVTPRITSIGFVGASDDAVNADLEFAVRGSLDDPAFQSDPWLARLHPDVVHVGASAPPSTAAPGVHVLPRPDVVGAGAFASVFCLLPGEAPPSLSRRLWVELAFEVEVEDAEMEEWAIGGMRFAGVPHLPYYVDGVGENSANFGLPRELRLAWDGTRNAGFIDAENALTWQTPTAHGGVYVLDTGPITGRTIRVRFADWPRLIRRLQPAPGGYDVVEAHGFAIPFLDFFFHQEGTRHTPRVSGGLVAATHHPRNDRSSAFGPTIPQVTISPAASVTVPLTASAQGIHGPSADSSLRLANGTYVTMSAGCLFGQRRRYAFGGKEFDEFFASGRLRPGESVRLTIAQSEEYPRVLAGLRLHYPPDFFHKYSTLPDKAIVDLDVYELDPPEGVSPVDPMRDPATDPYARRIHSSKRIRPAAEGVVCRFVRPSLSRYFALVFTAPAGPPRRVVLREIELIRSAHVEVGQRAARSQAVHQLRFRIRGPHLADDYARIGRAGFEMVVEHATAGQRRTVLLHARSLLDLLDLPTARLYANHRFWETRWERSADHTVIDPASYQTQTVRTRSGGWSQSRTGKGAHYDEPPFDAADPDAIDPRPDPTLPGFTAASSAEVRSQTNQLPPEAAGTATLVHDGIRDLVGQINHLIDLININASQAPGPTPQALPHLPTFTVVSPTLVDGDFRADLAWTAIWADVLTAATASIEGTTIVAVPPLLDTLIRAIDHASTAIHNLRTTATGGSGGTSLADVEDVQRMVRTAMEDLVTVLVSMSPMAGMSGIGVSMSGNVGVSGSVGVTGGWNFVGEIVGSGSMGMSGGVGEGLSVNVQLPTITHNLTFGRTGAITRQATGTGYSYARHANDRYEETRIRTGEHGGFVKRTVEREVDLDSKESVRSQGAEVRWGFSYTDILVGTVPLGIVLPARTEQVVASTDESVRVRFPNGIPDGVSVDVVFDVAEERVSDDY